MRTDAKFILEVNLKTRIDRYVLEIDASKGREFESSHLADHVGDGFNESKVLSA